MKIKITTLLISSLFITNFAFAESSFVDASDFTGDSFFTPAVIREQSNNNNDSRDNAQNKNNKSTVPPVKKLRLYVQDKMNERHEQQTQLAPTDPNASIYNSEKDTSDYASKEIEENFDENMMPDGFEADEESIVEQQKSKHFWSKNKSDKISASEDTENIVLDCENMDYDAEKYCLYATGNVNVEFVKQQTVVKADKITYDRMNNTIKAEGNVRIIKNNQVINGDYIFVDMNEENALIENPITQTSTIEVRATKGYVYGDKIIQEQGSIVVDESYPINFKSSGTGPILSQMMRPKDATLSNDMEKGLVKINAKELKITQKGDLETLAIRHANVKKGKWTILKIPAIKIYTNKNHDYAETNIWEVGSARGLGTYIGPGFVFELPKGSVLKAIPMLNMNHGFGVGAVGRFSSGTNITQAGYGTTESKILIRGKQKLDDNLMLQYAMNDYLDDWWLGRRRPKYGIDLVYAKNYSSNNFLIKNHPSSFTHQLDFGYFHDIDVDGHFKNLKGGQIGTLRTRYMSEASQNFLHYRNEDKQTAFDFYIVGQLAASVYGTGDTQIIGRVGPRIETQWKRWMQRVGYYQSVYDDNSPVPVYDAYRYGKSNVYLQEYFRVNKYLTLSWFGSLNLSNDSPNGKMFQENAFYVSIGPDDVKFNLGYDFIRENTFFTVEMMMDAKGTKIDYDKMEIRQVKKAQKEENEKKAAKPQNEFQNTNKAPVLQRAIVEDIKTVEDVL